MKNESGMRLVIIGFGYSASAFGRQISARCESLHVTARSAEKVSRLRADGWNALRFDGHVLEPAMLEALAKATHLLVSAPPGDAGDPVLGAFESQIPPMPALTRVLYLSTVGVYGDHDGAWVDENTVLKPVALRSIQRCAAERAWQDFAITKRVDLGIFRLSGIYGPGRSGIDALKAGTARCIIKPGQVFNRIHVDDIAGALEMAIMHPGPLGIFNVTDDEPCAPQEVVRHAAMLLGMHAPRDIPFDQADLSPMGRSFYGENKRVSNARIKSVLGYVFAHPSYREGLARCL